VEGLERQITHNRAHFGLPESVFLFGYIFDVNSSVERKNPLALVEAFRREYGDSADVLLVLKQSHGGGPRSAAADVVENAIAGATNIKVVDADFTAEEIASFHNALDCFVSPHRSEGFGFNLAEAMYLRKPVIATGYSGNVDFMEERNSYLIDYRLVQIEETVGPYLKGARWADPDGDHLRTLMRQVFEDASERQNKAAAAAETIRQRFSSQEAGRQMDRRFRDLGLEQPHVQRDLFSRHSTRGTPRFVHPGTPASVLEEIRSLPRKPLISVLAGPEDVTEIESVRAQWYPYWEVCIYGPEVVEEYRGMDPRIKVIAGTRDDAAEISTGEYVVDLEGPMAPEFLFKKFCRNRA
jgi:hypothetical protein